MITLVWRKPVSEKIIEVREIKAEDVVVFSQDTGHVYNLGDLLRFLIDKMHAQSEVKKNGNNQT